LLDPRPDPTICAADPRAYAVARARRAQLTGAPESQALAAVSQEQIDRAKELFGTKHATAIIAGGTIR